MQVTKTGLIVIIGDHFSKDVIKKEVNKIKHSSNVVVVEVSEYKTIIKECFTKGTYVSKLTDELTNEYYIAAILVNVNKFNGDIKSLIRVDEHYLLSSKNAFQEFPTYLLYANSYCGSTKDRMFNFYLFTVNDKKDPKYFGGVSSTSHSAEYALKCIIENPVTLNSIASFESMRETKSPCAEISLLELPDVNVLSELKIPTIINVINKSLEIQVHDSPIMLLLLV